MIQKTIKFSKIAWAFTIELIFKIWDWGVDTYEWISDAFTNWDTQLGEFWEQLIFMFEKTIEIIGWLIDKIAYFIREFGKLLNTLSDIIGGVMKGWR